MKINIDHTSTLNTADIPEYAEHDIEKISGDNWRPGMPDQGYLVRYDLRDGVGWRCCRPFETQAEAVFFVQGLQTGRFCDDEEKAALIAGVSAA